MAMLILIGTRDSDSGDGGDTEGGIVSRGKAVGAELKQIGEAPEM